MARRVLASELHKLRRAPIWVAFVALPVIAAAIGTFNYLQNLEILESGWLDLWTQHTLFTSLFFLPTLVGAGCSWLMGAEHAGSNWNQLMSAPVAAWRLVLAKLVAGELLLGCGLGATGLAFVACGKAAGLAGMPGMEYARWMALAWLGGTATVAVQLLVSLLVRSFAAPVGVALIGGVCGFLIEAKGFGWLCPYSLMQMALNSNGSGAVEPAQMPLFCVMTVALTGVSLAAATWRLTRCDVQTG